MNPNEPVQSPNNSESNATVTPRANEQSNNSSESYPQNESNDKPKGISNKKFIFIIIVLIVTILLCVFAIFLFVASKYPGQLHLGLYKNKCFSAYEESLSNSQKILPIINDVARDAGLTGEAKIGGSKECIDSNPDTYVYLQTNETQQEYGVVRAKINESLEKSGYRLEEENYSELDCTYSSIGRKLSQLVSLNYRNEINTIRVSLSTGPGKSPILCNGSPLNTDKSIQTSTMLNGKTITSYELSSE